MKTVAIVLLALFAQDKRKDKAPPKGPPWITDYREARWKALREGKPIFLYNTKTY